MTDPHASTASQSPDGGRLATRTQRGRLLDATIDVLTAAGRLSWPADDQRDEHREDWAEFVTQAIAGAAANLGSTEQALASRPASREAEAIRQLLAPVVGADDEYLQLHRTEPLVVDLVVADILAYRDALQPWEQATADLRRRWDTIDLPSPPPSIHWLPSPDQQYQIDQIKNLSAQLDQLRRDDWGRYADELTTAVRAAARRHGVFTGDVVVRVNLDEQPDPPVRVDPAPTLADELRGYAIDVTPLPWHGQPTPLARLEAAPAAHSPVIRPAVSSTSHAPPPTVPPASTARAAAPGHR